MMPLEPNARLPSHVVSETGSLEGADVPDPLPGCLCILCGYAEHRRLGSPGLGCRLTRLIELIEPRRGRMLSSRSEIGRGELVVSVHPASQEAPHPLRIPKEQACL